MSAEKIDLIFILLALSAVFVSVAFIILFVTFVTKKNKIITEKFKAELDYQKRIHQTELQALRSQMNPHFVHNSINAIQYYVQRNEVEISEKYLSKFSKLLRLFFDYSRRQYVTIEEEKALLENYLALEKLRFEDKIEYKITIDPALDLEEIRLPAMLLQPIVENAINHGLFHKPGKGLVTINFDSIDPATFKVTIDDNGIGINKAKELRHNNTDTVKAHSSEVLAERVALLNLSKEWEVTYTMVDKSDQEQQSGTRVTIEFKEVFIDPVTL